MTTSHLPAAQLSEADAKSEMDSLVADVLRHDRLYYELDAPEISDAEYDLLYERLLELEGEWPGLVRADSPTRRVSGGVAADMARVKHPFPMSSLEKTYATEGLEAFIKRALAFGESISLSVGPKLDGSSLRLTYDEGRLVQAATRGDGTYGEDVTANALVIPSIPGRVTRTGRFDVRGEVVIAKDDFEALIEEGYDFQNARNAASGSVRTKDPAKTAERKLSFYAYELVGVEGIAREQEALAELAALGFTLPPVEYFEAPTLESVEAACLAIHGNRDGYDYAIDGAVVKVTDFAAREAMGTTGHHPKYAIAYKWQPDSAQTRILGLTNQTGRTGIISPVAELDPVFFDGSTVSRATLHNYDFIAKMDIRIGDRIAIIKAGEIIPKVVHVDREARDGSETAIEPPTACPACGGPVTHAEDDFAYRCVNPTCPARAVAALLYAVDRTRLDIEGIGIRAAEALVAAGHFRNVADLYDLTAEDLVSSGATGQKNAEKVMAGIAKSKGRPFHAVLASFGIHTVGRSTSKTIERDFGGIDELMAATPERLMAVPDVGPTGADAIVAFFARDDTRSMVERLRSAGVTLTAAAPAAAPAADSPLAGKAVAVTGTLSQPRHEVQALIEAAGGRLASSVSAKTDFLVAGEGGGSKRSKAAQLGIPVIEEADLRSLLGQ